MKQFFRYLLQRYLKKNALSQANAHFCFVNIPAAEDTACCSCPVGFFPACSLDNGAREAAYTAGWEGKAHPLAAVDPSTDYWPCRRVASPVLANHVGGKKKIGEIKTILVKRNFQFSVLPLSCGFGPQMKSGHQNNLGKEKKFTTTPPLPPLSSSWSTRCSSNT